MKRLALMLTFTLLFSLAVPISAFADENEVENTVSEEEYGGYEVEDIGNVAIDGVILDEEAIEQLNELLTQAQYEFERENQQDDGNITTGSIVSEEEQVQASNENISFPSADYQVNAVEQNSGGTIEDIQVTFPASDYNPGDLIGGTIIINEAESQQQNQNNKQQKQSKTQENKGKTTKTNTTKTKTTKTKTTKGKNKSGSSATEEAVKKKLRKAGSILTKRVGKKKLPVVQYRYGGNTNPKITKDGKVKKRGVLDCSSLVKYVYKEYLNKNITRTTTSQYRNAKQKLTNLSQSNLKPGDLLFNRNLGHVGIYIGDGKVLHNSSSAGKPIIVSLSQFKPQQGARYLNFKS